MAARPAGEPCTWLPQRACPRHRPLLPSTTPAPAGEVMGIDYTFGKAYAKAAIAAGQRLPEKVSAQDLWARSARAPPLTCQGAASLPATSCCFRPRPLTPTPPHPHPHPTSTHPPTPSAQQPLPATQGSVFITMMDKYKDQAVPIAKALQAREGVTEGEPVQHPRGHHPDRRRASGGAQARRRRRRRRPRCPPRPLLCRSWALASAPPTTRQRTCDRRGSRMCRLC